MKKRRLSLDTVRTFESFNRIFMGLGIESVSVETAFMLGYPGANSVGYTGKLLNKLMDSLVDNISFSGISGRQRLGRSPAGA